MTLVGQEGALFTTLDWVDSYVHSHICSSGEPAVVQRLFADSSFTWDSGQHWLLLSSWSTSIPREMLTHPCSISGRKPRPGRAAISAHPLSLCGVLSGGFRCWVLMPFIFPGVSHMATFCVFEVQKYSSDFCKCFHWGDSSLGVWIDDSFTLSLNIYLSGEI